MGLILALKIFPSKTCSLSLFRLPIWENFQIESIGFSHAKPTLICIGTCVEANDLSHGSSTVGTIDVFSVHVKHTYRSSHIGALSSRKGESMVRIRCVLGRLQLQSETIWTKCSLLVRNWIDRWRFELILRDERFRTVSMCLGGLFCWTNFPLC